MRPINVPAARWLITAMIGVLASANATHAVAGVASLGAAKDTTLFQYDPNDPNSLFHSNGIGNFFAAGCTFSRSQIQRGLIQFDLSGIPAGATVVPGTLQLRLYVIDVPKKDTSPRPFWAVALTGLMEPWGEGHSLANVGSGAGAGAPAQPHDATWFHTRYDPAIHGDPPTGFMPNGDGFWPALGALGGDPLDPWTLYGAPAVIAPGVLGPVTFSSPSMVNDVNRWLADPSSNFGWIILGDETVHGPQLSSKRGFATHEHAIEAYRPLLTFEYTVAAVPEPASLPLAAASIILLLLCPRSQARLSTRNPLLCDASEGPADKDAQGEIEHASSGGR